MQELNNHKAPPLRLPNFNDFLSGVESCAQAARLNAREAERPRTFVPSIIPPDNFAKFAQQWSHIADARHTTSGREGSLRSPTPTIHPSSSSESASHPTTILPPLLTPKIVIPESDMQRRLTSSSPSVLTSGARTDRSDSVVSKDQSQPPSLSSKTDNRPIANQYTFSRWGLTKDNKPRKRLAQACNGCRLRKIKCVPGPQRCYDCTSRSVECVYETKRATGRRKRKGSSPKSDPIVSPTKVDEASSDVSSPLQSGSLMDESLSNDNTWASPASTTSIRSGTVDSVSGKARSSAESGHVRNETEQKSSASSQTTGAHSRSRSSQMEEARSRPSAAIKTLRFSIEVDPYSIDACLTDRLLEGYFSQQNSTEKWVLPKAATMRWVRTTRRKSYLDMMLLYAMLALGTLFTGDSKYVALRRSLQETCEEAVSRVLEGLNLQVIHTKLILARLCLNNDQSSKASELAASTIHMACAMGMYAETVQGSPPHLHDQQSAVLDFDENVTLEYRRRLFWSCSLLIYSVKPQQSLLGQHTRCSLRIPCGDTDYERGDIPIMPTFDGDIARTCFSFMADPGQRTTEMTLLCQIVQLWDSMLSHAYDLDRHLPISNLAASESFYRYVQTQLHAWDMTTWSESNAASGDKLSQHEERKGNTMLGSATSGLHLVYHDCGLILHRYVPVACMDEKVMARDIQKAYRHARTVLEIAGNLVTGTSNSVFGYDLVATSPFTARILLNAIDIVTCTGTIAEFAKMDSPVMRLVLGGLEVLDHLAEYWYEARKGRELVKERIQVLLSLDQRRTSPKQHVFSFSKPIHEILPSHMDLVYQAPRLRYLNVLGVGGLNCTEENLLRV